MATDEVQSTYSDSCEQHSLQRLSAAEECVLLPDLQEEGCQLRQVCRFQGGGESQKQGNGEMEKQESGETGKWRNWEMEKKRANGKGRNGEMEFDKKKFI